MTSSLQAMRDLLAEDTRYKLDAYQFIRESLQYAHEHMIGELTEDEYNIAKKHALDEKTR